MPVQHLEPWLDAGLASLKTNLPAAIAAINAERPDLVLAVPPDDGYALGAFEGTPSRYPFVEVAVPDWTLGNLSVGQVIGDLDMAFVVKVLAEEIAVRSAEALYRRLMRYATAVLRVLLQPDAFGDGIIVDSVRGAYRYNPETGQREEIRGGVILVFSLAASESSV